MRSVSIHQMGPKSYDKSPYKKRTIPEERKAGHVKMELDVKSEAATSQGTSRIVTIGRKLEEEGKDSPLETLEGVRSC